MALRHLAESADDIGASAARSTRENARIAVIVLNYCTPELALQAAASAVEDVDPEQDLVIIVDNASPDGSADTLASELAQRSWTNVRLIRSAVNGGFAAGNNVGIRAASAEAYLLLNSDTIVKNGTISRLFAVLREDRRVGIASPQLTEPDGQPQVSCFRFHSLASEFARGSSTGLISKLLSGSRVAIGVQNSRVDVPWTSFACVLVSRTVIDEVGPLDEGYFMYFEDADYCRMVREAGFRIVHEPQGRVVHLRGKSSPVKQASRQRKARPAYYYAARNRYFTRRYGPWGPAAANLAWSVGNCIMLLRELVERKQPVRVEGEFLDNWRG